MKETFFSFFFFYPRKSKTVNPPTHLEENMSQRICRGKKYKKKKNEEKRVKCYIGMGHKHTLKIHTHLGQESTKAKRGRKWWTGGRGGRWWGRNAFTLVLMLWRITQQSGSVCGVRWLSSWLCCYVNESRCTSKKVDRKCLKFKWIYRIHDDKVPVS